MKIKLTKTKYLVIPNRNIAIVGIVFIYLPFMPLACEKIKDVLDDATCDLSPPCKEARRSKQKYDYMLKRLKELKENN